VVLAGAPASAQTADAAAAVDSQTPPERLAEPLRSDADPTRPVFFSIRPELYGLGGGDATRSALIFRYDRAQLRQRRWLPGKRGVITRFELPVATVAGTGTTRAGLGDAYGQLLVAPYFTSRFAFVAGSGLRVPTATDPLLGAGKWVVVPTAAPVWFFGRKAIFVILVQNLTSVAGDATRPDLNVLQTTPTYVHTFVGRWWLLADSAARTDWRRNQKTSVTSGLQLGRQTRGRFSAWVKPEFAWNGPQQHQWNLRFGLVWYR
jgi:hypothetical protein